MRAKESGLATAAPNAAAEYTGSFPLSDIAVAMTCENSVQRVLVEDMLTDEFAVEFNDRHPDIEGGPPIIAAVNIAHLYSKTSSHERQ